MSKMGFHGSLAAFWRHGSHLIETSPCSIIRLPGYHYLPGGSPPNYCKDPRRDVVLGILQHVQTRIIRAVHLSSVKLDDRFNIPGQGSPHRDSLEHCPLVAYLVSVSRGDFQAAHSL